MNKLTKLMLASAMMITSGFASDVETVKEFATGSVNLGSFDVNYQMKINAVGVYHFMNAGTMTFKSGSSVTSDTEGKIGNIYNLELVKGADLASISDDLNKTLGNSGSWIVYEVKPRGTVINETEEELGVRIDNFSLASTVTWGWKDVGEKSDVVYNLVSTVTPSIDNAVAISGIAADMGIFKDKNHKFVSLPGTGEVAAGVLLENNKTDLEQLKYLSGPVFMNLPPEHDMEFNASENVSLKSSFIASKDGEHSNSIIFDAEGNDVCFEGDLDLKAVDASFKNGRFIFVGKTVI